MCASRTAARGRGAAGKYASKAEQDAHLEASIAWVREYDTREGELGRKAHEALFEAYRGPKVRFTELPREGATL
ncbi:MAG: hypothetical protein IPJ77_21460 [Planctomycetes bacterium]|nr:hypothetical protein [Planctomycetota bacterium]